MVTARQIQQLTRQRLEGTVPSYPEQWLEGPMVRRERRIMNRGGVLYGRRAKTLPRLKPGGDAEAPAAKPTDADARLAGFAARPRSAEVESAEGKRARTERALAVIAAGGGADEHALRLPVRPLVWPRGRDEQLQTVRAIKRMLRELDAHLKSASSTLSEALPRRSVTGDGLVSVATLHAWLRSLTRAADEKRGGARAAFDDDARFERRAEAVRKEYAKGAPLPPAVVRAMVALLDGGGTGVVALRDLVECFRVATRLAIDADKGTSAPRAEVTDEAKEEDAKDTAAVEDAAVEDDEPVDPELAWWTDEQTETAAARAKADADAALDKADDPPPSLAAGGAYGAVTEADVHELVDVLFSEHDELLFEELERATRALRRAWAVAHAGHRYGYANEEGAARAESQLEASYAYQPGDSAFLPSPGDEAPFAAGLPLHASRIFAALEHYLFAREGMRFMEFVKLHCLPCGSLFNEGRGVADAFATVHEVRHVLCRLFDASTRADAAGAARNAYKAAREHLDALEVAARQPSASPFERHMRRSGLDAAFRKVDALIQRRGMKLKEVCELLDQDGEGRCDSSRLAAFLQAVGVRKPPPSYEVARRKNVERETAAAAAAAERRREEADFAARMRAAEQSGCVASFALMDRYFCRYQLKAEDIWTHGRAKKTTGLDRAAESHEDDSDAVGPDDFHRMLQTAKVHLSSEQVAKLVAYLDTDGSGKIEHRELQAAMLDYRRFKRAKQRLELQRAERERRLFLDRQVLVLLQYLVLVGGARDAPVDAGKEQSIEVAEFQRAIGRASHLPIAQYLRGIRERLHSGAYEGLAALRSSAATELPQVL